MTNDTWPDATRLRAVEEMLANPDFLAHASTVARRDARGARLAIVLQGARSVLAELLAADRPIDLLNVRIGSAASAADSFTTISTLFFVPWAHGDCSRRVADLQRMGEAVTRLGRGPASDPLTAFYEAVALDIGRQAQPSDRQMPIKLWEKRLDIALQEYTRALTAWMKSVLGW